MASKRILIVDDEPNIGSSLQLILEREGYSVSICHSTEEFRREPARRAADTPTDPGIRRPRPNPLRPAPDGLDRVRRRTCFEHRTHEPALHKRIRALGLSKP